MLQADGVNECVEIEGWSASRPVSVHGRVKSRSRGEIQLCSQPWSEMSVSYKLSLIGCRPPPRHPRLVGGYGPEATRPFRANRIAGEPHAGKLARGVRRGRVGKAHPPRWPLAGPLPYNLRLAGPNKAAFWLAACFVRSMEGISGLVEPSARRKVSRYGSGARNQIDLAVAG